MRPGFTYSSSEWSGPGATPSWRGRFRLGALLRALIIPPKGQRILPTLTGYVLIVIAIGLGMAAYNAASNILFIALSLLLASLIVSGILSWINFHGISWRILADPPFRAGEECHVRIEIKNTKKYLPTYALTLLVEAVQTRARKPLRLGQRLDPQGTVQLDFCFTPEERGRETVRIAGVVSQFPFGFLRKTLGGNSSAEMIIWPRRVSYRFKHGGAAVTQLSGRALSKPGHGSEFFNLRAYRSGDSHRQIHWKASARLQNLVVQQFSAENHTGFVFCVQTPAELWADRAQFEKLCSLVSSMAEDLFRLELLHGARINSEPQQRIARRADLEFFQDQLATLERVPNNQTGMMFSGNSVVTFEPNPGAGINAYVGGQKAATT